MIDNFRVIRPLLEFPKKGDSFYFVQVLQRKKDHPGIRIGGSNNNSRLIRAYQVESLQYLDDHEEEMKKLAHVFDARVGINLNPRSYEKTAFQLIEKVAQQMSNKDFRAARKAYDSVCGHYHAEMDKRWLVDIDTKDMDFLSEVRNFIYNLQQKFPDSGKGILATLETRNGYHIITNSFNSHDFGKQYPDIEIHKNNPTNMYIP